MKPLPSQALLHALLKYEPTTGKLFWKKRDISTFVSVRAANSWNTRYAGTEAFTAVDRNGYLIGAINNSLYRAARIIYMMQYNKDPIQVDHLDGNRTNNRIQNLRSVSPETNSRNMKLFNNNTSGHAGVIWDAKRKLWCARISDKGRTINLGRFSSIDDAIAVRKQAEHALKYHPSHGKR